MTSTVVVSCSYPVPGSIILIAVIDPLTMVAVNFAPLPEPTTLTVGGVVYSTPESSI